DVNRGRSGSRSPASDSDDPAPFDDVREERPRREPPDLDPQDVGPPDLDPPELGSPDLDFGWDEPADPPELDERPARDEPEANGGGGAAGFLKRVQNSAARLGNGARKDPHGENGSHENGGNGNGNGTRGYAARARDLLNRRTDLV